ncbi:MAG: dTMP kinase [Phycisphaerales bacterium]|nr:dTMP kinase [Phycisphaerales bacterium]
MDSLKTQPPRPPGKLLVFEGIDASGKSTQVRLLREWLDHRSVPYKYWSFPRTAERGYGEIIRSFLHGEFGSLEHVDPLLIAAVFAADRLSLRSEIQSALGEGLLVVIDRYVASNIAFQCAKALDQPRRESIREWIETTEYQLSHMPRADITLYLDVPTHFAAANVAHRAKTHVPTPMRHRDIHEASSTLQRRVASEYAILAKGDPTFHVIQCHTVNGSVRSESDIFAEIQRIVSTRLALASGADCATR